mmetsp:Transcript_107334/g.239638  ORF Transcript_107334/g.239638 Transcript_107334/m.239638 type:complete len:200 (-) Transcript_107334:1667-2266(-)
MRACAVVPADLVLWRHCAPRSAPRIGPIEAAHLSAALALATGRGARSPEPYDPFRGRRRKSANARTGCREGGAQDRKLAAVAKAIPDISLKGEVARGPTPGQTVVWLLMQASEAAHRVHIEINLSHKHVAGENLEGVPCVVAVILPDSAPVAHTDKMRSIVYLWRVRAKAIHDRMGRIHKVAHSRVSILASYPVTEGPN